MLKLQRKKGSNIGKNTRTSHVGGDDWQRGYRWILFLFFPASLLALAEYTILHFLIERLEPLFSSFFHLVWRQCFIDIVSVKVNLFRSAAN